MKRLLMMSLLSLAVALPATAMPTPVSQLPVRCTYDGCNSCSLISDATSGVCRTIRYSTPSGEIKVQVCDKGDRYELYRQLFPAGLSFDACTGGGCVDEAWGFRAFTSTTLPAGCEPEPPEPTIPPQSLVDPNSTGFANESRALNHARLLDAWWNNTKVVQPYANGTAAWVPWYTTSSECTVARLNGGCNPPGGLAADRNCMVTDEFSQVLLASAQGTVESRVQKLVATLQAIDGNYGALPAWIVTRTGDTLLFSDRNSASDADARIVLALFIAAGSTHFSPAARDNFRTRALALASDFLQHDFRHECRTGRNGVPICWWLASGGAQVASGLGSYKFAHAGYFGDAVIALLAAYRASGNQNYLNAAKDTVNAYLLAANFNGSSFSVPPLAFRWDTSVSPPRSQCTGWCTGEWDYHDAPRAVSICKAKYYATKLNVSLPADLDAYCNAWMNAGGITSTAYQPKYRDDGTVIGSPNPGPYENGLGLSLNFFNTAWLVPRLDSYRTHFDPNGGEAVWDSQDCHGVYENAFHTTNLGSAMGRDLHAFQP
jgi:hypothetical protein